MLELLDKMNSLGWYTVILSIVATILLIPLAKTAFEKFKEAMGWTDKRLIKEQKLEERLQKIEKKISEVDKRVTDTSSMYDTKLNGFHNQSIEIRGRLADEIHSVQSTQTEIKDSLSDLKRMFIDNEIDTIRWEILNFANAVIDGKDYNKEQYDHVFEVYEKYEKILEANGMENGRVDMSMEFVTKKYGELMQTGFRR